jgi:pSer/pThr/pTyr-binding forkhead associated (FHA) protein
VTELILEVVEGADAGRQVPLTGTIEIGRERSLPLPLEDWQTSRRHARISLERGQPIVEDLGSTNGTYVNEQQVQTPHWLRAGDRIRVGLTVLELRTAEQVSERPSAVHPIPPVTAAGDVLQPAAPHELAPPPPPPPPPPAAAPTPPAYVPREAAGDFEAQSSYHAAARLVDARVKLRTNVAAFALLGASALAVILAFGLK